MFDWVIKPEAVRYPSLSLFAGRWAEWLYNFSCFLGLRPGPFGRVLSWLANRARKVQWSRMSFEKRMKAAWAAIFMGHALVFPLKIR